VCSLPEDSDLPAKHVAELYVSKLAILLCEYVGLYTKNVGLYI